ncbi:motility associated factor glycosyltransferase family protein [Spirochaeta cellobiosiphila]|uniref:motility associated factor glycosyltransferase family protein n=1 Tax=Spirochaeta cellobiosiphila TaxID=504483 RepID=UPI0003FA28C7|nr:6-hydroxymethylpterin diphosphokinase MptE-like protein [Spirochaeta cellobiosiphila]
MNYWDRNWLLLEKKYPQIAEIKPIAWEPNADFEWIYHTNDKPSAKWKGRYLHSSRAPGQEAKKIAESYLNRDNPSSGWIYYGLGLGYVPEVILEQSKQPYLIVEPDIDLFYHLLYHQDYSTLFSHPGFNLLVSAPSSGIHFFLEDIIGGIVQWVPNKAYQSLFPELWTSYIKEYDAYQERRKINRNTLKRFGKLWIHNMARNIGSIEKYPGIQLLQNVLHDIPVIILAAGPSLDEGLAKYAQLKNRAFIIAVDTVCTALKHHGVKPDMVISVDPQYWNSRHLDRFNSSQVILVTDSTTYGSLLNDWQGPVFLTASHFPLCEYLEAKIAPKGKIAAGGSVTTAAWDLARIMGSKEIYICGMDLGYPNGRTHMGGAFFEERMNFIANRWNTSEKQSYQYIYSGNPTFDKDYQEQLLLTDQRLTIYRTWFERILPRYKDITNRTLSPRGLHIKSLAPYSINEFLSNRTKINRQGLTEKIVQKQNELSQKTFLEVNNIVNDLKKMKKACRLGIDCIKGPLSIQQKNKQLSHIDQIIISNPARHAASYLILPYMEDLINSTNLEQEKAMDLSESFYDSLLSTLNYTISQMELGLDQFQRMYRN